MYKNITEIKAAHAGYWFSKGAMSFFGTRISPKVHPSPIGAYFVTSEVFDGDSGRLYTVRFCDSRGDIKTVGDFQQYETPEGAHDAARRAAADDRANNDL